MQSPLRYPGGKAKLFPFFAELLRVNNLVGCNYHEPYAGGAGLAIKLLLNGFAETVAINDIDSAVYCFWLSVFHYPDKICRMIEKTPVTLEEWNRQRSVWRKERARDPVELGFATFFLNRTNRSGIIEGAGPIGGHHQSGDWKIDVRMSKSKHIFDIMTLSRYAKQVAITNFDAMDFLKRLLGYKRSIIYLDPPYFEKGRKLYRNFYAPDDHRMIADVLKRKRASNWVVSYDNVREVRRLYGGFDRLTYSLNYCAGPKTISTELIFLSDALARPKVSGFRAS